MHNFDEIRKEVALRHNVLLTKDDPVLVAMTVSELSHERFLKIVSERYEAAGRDLVNALSHQMTTLLQLHDNDAKTTASRLVNEVSGFIDGQLRTSVSDALAEVKEQLEQSLTISRIACQNAITANNHAQAAKNSVYIAAFVTGFIALAAIAACAALLRF